MPPTDPLTTLLVLADSRLPAGGHAHSGGLEPAVAAGRVTDLPSLAGFLRGRLATAGRIQAAFAAAGCAHPGRATALNRGLDARTPSPAQRRASYAQGRALLRAGRALYPGLTTPPPHHHPVAVGLVAAAAGLPPGQAAAIAAYGAVSGPASAAVRLLGLDPYGVHGLLAALAPECDAVAAEAAADADAPVADLPAGSAPLLDLSAELHADWEVRLFAS
ncbi:urease accessory protein UreF [Natronosporangium hydrolyticum]|uniref:urease accessory protein UreF n=1 Tax=Natronosporangium hydrolyticum TaxID=2811111 RepID=UPI001EFA18A7|nr:urease accessory UreF family protein [Natronosporangium hydrolyticum]